MSETILSAVGVKALEDGYWFQSRRADAAIVDLREVTRLASSYALNAGHSAKCQRGPSDKCVCGFDDLVAALSRAGENKD